MKRLVITQPVTTTAREVFSGRDTQRMAALVLRRFGYDVPAAAAAWRRLLGNNCPDHAFAEIAEYGRLDARPLADR